MTVPSWHSPPEDQTAAETPWFLDEGALDDAPLDNLERRPPPRPAPIDEAPVIAGRYRLERALGEGSSAAVYAATDLRLQRPVTIKLFDPSIAADPGLRLRFQRQAAKAAPLQHPAIASLLDAGFTNKLAGGERPFVVLEPAGVLSLRDLLDQRGKLAAAWAVRIARQLASALRYAHEHQVVHGDVKPENVILDDLGQRAKLVDFSLSFVSARTGLVTPQTIARRAAYLAPEQVRGEPIGPQADVYALGALLYEMLVGRPPFVGATPRATAELRVKAPLRPTSVFDPSVPASVESIVSRALERDPARRWRSMAELEQALARLDRAQLAPRDPHTLGQMAFVPYRPARRPRRQPLSLLVPLVAAAFALGVAGTFGAPLLRSLPHLGGLVSQQAPTAPDVVGMTVDQAHATASASGIELVVVGERVTDKTPRGQIVQQAPVAGFQLDAKQPLRVTVSSGVSVPDIRGKTLPQAEAELAELGWKIARIDRGPQPAAAPGTIALQSPAPGETVPGPGELAVVVAE
jgi:serine/threonine protein kinase